MKPDQSADLKVNSVRPHRPLPWRFLKWCLLIAAGCYFVVLVLMYAFQRQLIYMPNQYSPSTIQEKATQGRLEPWTNASGQTIGWRRMSPTAPATGQVIVMHGQGGAAVDCGFYADILQRIAPLHVFMLEYPGFAGRPGAAKEQSIYEAASEALLSLHSDTPIFLIGESLGTGVATYVAGRFPEKVAGIVVLGAYDTLAHVGQYQKPFIPVGLLLTERFPAKEHLRSYHGHVAVVVVRDDTTVPARFGHNLYTSYAGPKRLWEIPQGDHGAIDALPEETWRQIVDFWRGK